MNIEDIAKAAAVAIWNGEWERPSSVDLYVEVIAAHLAPLAEENRKLAEALRKTVEVVHTWHGEVAWDIYVAHCPELQPARDALAAWESARG